jgi:hypothetical protein
MLPIANKKLAQTHQQKQIIAKAIAALIAVRNLRSGMSRAKGSLLEYSELFKFSE